MRVNKYLASTGICSRRKADEFIKEGRIKINGKDVEQGQQVDVENDVVEFDGERVSLEEEKEYFLLNKPAKVLCAVSDESNKKLVTDLIDTKNRIYPVGRLDYETEGLIILTNDGDFFNKIIHPRAMVYKTYLAKLRGQISEEALKHLEEGVELDDGMTLPSKVKLVNDDSKNSWIRISIREGRNRQVRRMCKEVGNEVLYLKREAIAGLRLQNLASGEYRHLKTEELEYLKNL